jgi:23S rRNA pseudouridine2457 synthase
VRLSDFNTQPAEVRAIAEPAGLWPRAPPIRIRKNVPANWIEPTIREGKNRQVRCMTAAVSLPTLRLIRYRVGAWSLDGLEQGEWRIESA